MNVQIKTFLIHKMEYRNAGTYKIKVIYIIIQGKLWEMVLYIYKRIELFLSNIY